MNIEQLLPELWPDVKRIYESGIATGNATFQTAAPGWDEWDADHLKHSRFVAVDNTAVVGWAALTAVSGRCVYAGVAEISVYIDEQVRGRGIGQLLLNTLVEDSEANNLWTLQAGIFPENKASIAIHKKAGFRIVGYREKIGKMNGAWRDTILLERRSNITGL